MEEQKRGRVIVAPVMRKRTTFIDKTGQVISEETSNNKQEELKNKMRAKAKRLGLPFKE